MRHKLRKLLCAALLLIGLPVYAVLAVTLVSLFDRPSPILELAIYVGLGFAWALPLRPLFRGIGRADPNASRVDEDHR